ncbi:MAG: DDE-type integrase/transposase/recombinase [Terrimicrobiaceae bacterium]
MCALLQMLAGIMEKEPDASSQEPALIRHNAVSFIQQSLSQGHTLGRALALASQLAWGGRHYSPRTLEGWLYDYRAAGFAALHRQSRRDKGQIRALPPEGVQAILKLRLSQPALPVSALVRQLLAQGVLEPGTFSMPSVYRVLRREGLDRPRLLAETNGPTKAFETELPNTLWMADIMDGPTLRLPERVLRTFLFATLDDCSRLVPHAQYYENEKLRSLLDCLRQAFACRGLPEKLYTDQGKIFTCSHLRVVCANLRIRLLHARPYAAWSKGKIERFFQTVQRDFEARLRLDPVHDLDGLNNRFWQWLGREYHRRAHSALDGQFPAERFAQKAASLRQLPADTDWQQLFLARATRRVRLDATVSLEGNLWEVPLHLRGRQVELHYDPFDWSRVEVWYRERFAALARRCDKHLNAKIYSSRDYER